jgi:hypothetical protein
MNCYEVFYNKDKSIDKGDHMRLGIGEFFLDEKDVDNSVVEAARKTFLNKVQEIMPQFWEDLYDGCYKIYCNIDNKSHIYSWEKLKNMLTNDKKGSLVLLYKTIITWAKKHNLNYEWVLDIAMQTLRYWYESGDGPREFKLEPPIYAIDQVGATISTEEKHIRFSFYWDPLVMTKKEAKYWIKRLIDKKINEEVDRIMGLMEKGGYKKVPEKRDYRGDHFQWAAYYHVRGWSYEKIAQHLTDKDPKGKQIIDADAVRKGISDVIALTDIDTQKRS